MSRNHKIRSKLISIIDSEQFFVELNNVHSKNRRESKSIGSELAALHNEKKIDIIAKFITVTEYEDQNLLSNMIAIFDYILPTVNSPVPDVLECLSRIHLKVNANLYARSCNRGLKQYCDQQEDRASQILTYSLANISDSLDFISIALISGAKSNLDYFTNKAIELTSHNNENVQNSALFSLGKINYSTNLALIDKVLNATEKILKVGYSDLLYSSVIQTLINIYSNTKFSDIELLRLLTLALVTPDKETLSVTSWLFGFNMKDLPDSVINLFLEVLSEVSPSSTSELEHINYGLSTLLDRGNEELIISFLEVILIKNKGVLSITVFSDLLSKIQKNNNAFLNTLATKWFLSNKMVLQKAISEIVKNKSLKHTELSVDTNSIISTSEGTYLLLAKKACGWLYMSPISAVSFMLSLIEFSSKREIKLINEIILNPLLLSYSGSVKEYLNDKLENGTTVEKEAITVIFEGINKYHQGLEKSWGLKELRPSLAQREAYQRQHNEDLNKAYKEASKNSIMSSLLGKPQVLLYGNTSIYTMHGADNSNQRQEMPLSQLKTSFEFPSLEVLDPHGMDDKLWAFKTEGYLE